MIFRLILTAIIATCLIAVLVLMNMPAVAEDLMEDVRYVSIEQSKLTCVDVTVVRSVTGGRPIFQNGRNQICNPRTDIGVGCYLRGWSLDYNDTKGNPRVKWSKDRTNTVKTIERQCFTIQ